MLQIDGVHIYIVDIAAYVRHVDDYLRLLSEEERQRALGIRFERVRISYVVMRGLLRFVLSKYIKLSPSRLNFSCNSHGKPGLAGGVKFNISHSGVKGIIGIAGEEMGVDIEKIDPRHISPEMIENVFTENEKEYLKKLDKKETVMAFYRGWVRKESIIKAWGTGLTHPVNQLETCLNKPACLTRHARARWYTCDVKLRDSDYLAALTVSTGSGKPTVKLFYQPEFSANG